MRVGGQRHAPAVLLPEKKPVPIAQETGVSSEPACTGEENLVTTGARILNRPALASRYTASRPEDIIPPNYGSGWM